MYQTNANRLTVWLCLKGEYLRQEKLPGSQPVAFINTDAHQAPDSSLVHISTKRGWLLGVRSGRIILDALLCLIWADFLYQEGQSAFGSLYLYQRLFPLGALTEHTLALSDGPELENVIQIQYILYIFSGRTKKARSQFAVISY